MLTIRIDLKNIIGEMLDLAKPGNECEAVNNDAASLECFKEFRRVCEGDGEHTHIDMTKCAALLFEMQTKNNVPEEYTELSECFADLVKKNKKLDVSERRDYVFFAYEVMRELVKLENMAFAELDSELPDGVFAIASQDDDISAIGIVNNSSSDIMVNVEISGLPGRQTSIDYYCAREYEPLSIVCNTDTKLEKTTVMIPLDGYSLHLFKIR